MHIHEREGELFMFIDFAKVWKLVHVQKPKKISNQNDVTMTYRDYTSTRLFDAYNLLGILCTHGSFKALPIPIVPPQVTAYKAAHEKDEKDPKKLKTEGLAAHHSATSALYASLPDSC